MALTPYSGNTDVIAALGTTPQERGLTTQQFKAKFDEAFKKFITEYFNTTHIGEINSHLADTVTDADGVHGFKIEYGTFTPTLSNGTTEVSAYDVALTAGYYRKLKDVVFFDLSIKVTTIGGVTGGLRVGGFPFATKGEPIYAHTSITELVNLNFGTDMIGFELFGDTSRLMRSRSASTLSEFAFSDISDGFFMRASGQYRAAS